MRHRKKDRHFSRPYALRKALFRSLVRAILLSGRITTTDAKAKATASAVEKIITLAKQNTLHARRLANDYLQDHLLVKHLFDTIAPRFKTRAGGYTHILKLGGFRKGDGASLSIVEFIDYQLKERKGAKEEPAKAHKPVKEKAPVREKEAPIVKEAVVTKEVPVVEKKKQEAVPAKPKKEVKEGLLKKLFKKDKPEAHEKPDKKDKKEIKGKKAKS